MNITVIRVLQKGLRPILALYIAASLILSGCATQSAQPVASEQSANAKTPYELPQGAKVALVAGQSDLKITYGDGPNYIGSPVYLKRQKRNYTVEGLVIAGFSPVYCLQYLLAYPLCVAMLTVGGPTIGIARDLAPAIPESSDKGPEKTPEEVAADRKAAEEKLAAMQDTIKRYLTGTNTPLARRPLVVRVQGYARESGGGDFLVLTNDTPQVKSERPGYENQVDYVFDVAVTHIEIRPGVTTGPGVYAVEFTGAGRLIHLQDNVVVDEFTETSSRLVPLEPFTTTNARIVSERLDVALQDLAEMLVDYWIKPTMKGSH